MLLDVDQFVVPLPVGLQSLSLSLSLRLLWLQPGLQFSMTQYAIYSINAYCCCFKSQYYANEISNENSVRKSGSSDF